MERLEHDIPDPKRISIQQVSKNNGIVLDGLTIMENDCNISPTLYLNYYYDSYSHGISFNDVYQSLLSDYHRHKPRILILLFSRNLTISGTRLP